MITVSPVFLIFKEKYRIELKNPDHQYGDTQIARVCEEHAPWIMNNTSAENPVLSDRQLSAFLTAVIAQAQAQQEAANADAGEPQGE